jgi:lambda repressor-like predicted transcriptional regulator
MADFASKAEFKALALFASVAGPQGLPKADGRWSVCRLAGEMQRFVRPDPRGELPMNDDRLRPLIGRGGLVVIIKRDQVLAACAARGMSLEDLRLAAGLSRPTLQAALRGKRVRPSTMLKLAQALRRHPVLEEATQLLVAS